METCEMSCAVCHTKNTKHIELERGKANMNVKSKKLSKEKAFYFFTCEPTEHYGRLEIKAVNKIKKKCEEKIEVEIYKGVNRKLKEYQIEASPDMVTDGGIRIVGCVQVRNLKEA